MHYLLPVSLSAQVQLTDSRVPRYLPRYQSTIGYRYCRANPRVSQALGVAMRTRVQLCLTRALLADSQGPRTILAQFRLQLFGIANEQVPGGHATTGTTETVGEGESRVLIKRVEGN